MCASGLVEKGGMSMAKGNDKKVAKLARDLLLRTLGNLLESYRERKFTYAQRARPLPRRLFCRRTGSMVESTVAHIETGRFLSLDFAQLRRYLATTHGRNDQAFVTSARRVYDGLKEVDGFLKML
jgi:hypothetical protein